MDLNDYGTMFLRPSEIEGDKKLIVKSDVTPEKNQWGKKRLVLKAEFNGRIYKVNLAAPHVNQLVRILGGESADWLNSVVGVRSKKVTLQSGEPSVSYEFFKI